MFRIGNYKDNYLVCLYVQGHAVDKNRNGERLTVDLTILRKDKHEDKYYRNKNKDTELDEMREKLIKCLNEPMKDKSSNFDSDYYVYRQYLNATVSPANHREEKFADVLLTNSREIIVKNIGSTVKDILNNIKPCLSSFDLI